MPASPARAAAFDILLRVERESSYASELLHSTAYHDLSTADHALTTELVMGVLRWRSLLDDEISTASSQPLKKLDLEVLIALRLAVYQFRWLTRIPPRAALHESVELVKRARKRSAAPFVNAVLRELSRPLSSRAECVGERSDPTHTVEGPCLSSTSAVSSSSPRALATCYAHPLWLVERWTNHYGPEAAQQICRHNQSIPATTLRLRTPAAEQQLTAEGISMAPGSFLAGTRRVLSGDITKTKSFRATDVVIQDEASQLIAALVRQDHKQILDCCAAPGGKTLAIADGNPGATFTAVEIHLHRVRLMQSLFPANPQIRIVAADARNLPFTRSFDRILADVPCSGTGTLARNPEIKWRLKPDDLKDLHVRQLAILRSAATHLSPGGRLIYSTCSLEKEENEDVVEQALNDDRTLRRLDCATELNLLKSAGILTWPDPASLTRGPYLRTIPGVHPCDGFFAAVIERS